MTSSVAAAAVRPATRVRIAIPTFRRPVGLARLLAALPALDVPAETLVDVLVLDNDPAGSARDVVRAYEPRIPFALRYAHVLDAGLSKVRNAALESVDAAIDFLAMIDDDEVPEAQWLTELLRIAQATRADVVIGPVPRRLPERAAVWLKRGRFFDLPLYADGAAMKDGYSGNCLLRASSVVRTDVRFDAAFNLAGGEDLAYFRQLQARGARLAFAARAVAEESVDADRLTGAYVLQLNFRRGNTLSLYDRLLDGRPAVIATRAFKATARMLFGCAALVPRTALRGRTGAMLALCDVVHGAGGIAGLFGHTYLAYDRPARAT